MMSSCSLVNRLINVKSNARRSNQEFYDRTVRAMDAKSAAVTSDQEVGRKLREAESAAKYSSDGHVRDSRKPPEIVLDAGEKSVTGRKKIKGGEKWDVSTGKESTVGEKQEEVVKTEEEKDVELELNTILKRSLSMHKLHLFLVLTHQRRVADTLLISYNIFKILLPLFEESKGHIRNVHYSPCTIHSRVRSAPARSTITGVAREKYR